MRSRIANFTLLLLVSMFFFGCSKYVEMPDLNFKLPAQDSSYSAGMSSFSFALAEPEILIKTSMTRTTNSGLFDRIKQDVDTTSCYINSMLEKVLLSKGFILTDQIQSYNNMTFRQKSQTGALFFPKIVINIVEKSQFEHSSFLFISSESIRSLIHIEAMVELVLIEPLSGEKLWLTSLPVAELDMRVMYDPEIYSGMKVNGYYVPINLEDIAKSIDGFFENIGVSVVDATATNVTRLSFENLQSDIDRLKGKAPQ